MIRGLDIFKDFFAKHTDQFILIGGTACSILMENAGLEFRSTKDLDIVLCIEVLNAEFVSAFWRFIKLGNYQYRQKSTGKDIFYRFYSPSDNSFPAMLELFSRVPDSVKLEENIVVTPIPVNESLASLSAILMDTDYYNFIHSGKKEVNGLAIINAECLIPLKARAWIDLHDRKSSGAEIDEKDIRKHKNDILRLYQLLSSNQNQRLPVSISNDMKLYLDYLKDDGSIDLKSLGIKNTSLGKIISDLKNIYSID